MASILKSLITFPFKLFKKKKAPELNIPSTPKEYETPSLPTFEEKPLPAFPETHETPDSEKLMQYLQLINTKLDLIKLKLESMDQKIKEIEKIAKEESESKYSY
jgi:hypothetical protein